jgi:membrane associated rhomboid family serine protease
MRNNILDEIRESFREGSTLTKLIYINLAVFVVVKLVQVFYVLFVPAPQIFIPGQTTNSFRDIVEYLMVPSDLSVLLFRPWSIITYNFLHIEFLHILFNLLMLFWFGRIFLHFLTGKQLLTTYILGGIIGGATFILAYNVFPGLSSGQALGASASVTAIVMAISFYHPEYSLNLFFIGPVKLKYIAAFYIVLDVIQIAGDNPGGHIAHLGGALYGYLFAMQLKRGKDTGKGFGKFMDALVSAFKRKPRMKVSYKSEAKNLSDEDYNQSKAATQKEVDKILDKIAKSGYDSLTKKEKETLFKLSDKG